MKYYSEKLNRLFETEKELVEAENIHDKKLAEEKEKKEKAAKERKARAAEIDAAREAKNEACRRYNELLEAFIQDYGSYHTTISDSKELDLDWLNSDLIAKFFFG